MSGVTHTRGAIPSCRIRSVLNEEIMISKI